MEHRNIEAERVRNCISRETLASTLGISTRAYYNWINGKSDIPSLQLLKIARLFHVSMEYLLGEKEPEEKGLGDFKTCQLVEELKKRDGVTAHIAEPYKDFEITVNGPANVLVVID